MLPFLVSTEKKGKTKKKRKTLFSEVYAITARSFVVCCLCMCNDVTVRHRKTFLNDREFLNMVSIFYSVLCHFPLDIPYQWRGWDIFFSKRAFRNLNVRHTKSYTILKARNTSNFSIYMKYYNCRLTQKTPINIADR